MSRAKREKKKINVGIILLIVCIIVVAITFFMLHDLKGKADEIKQQNTVNFVEIVNTVEDEETIENEIEENIVEENEVVENNTVKNTTNTSSKNTTSSQNTNQAPYTPATTDDKQKAIDLVKAEWGEDSTVSFSFEYINENGEYVISVRDKSSATVKNYFRVDLSSGTVDLD